MYFRGHENRACLFVIILLFCSKFRKEPIGVLPTSTSSLLPSLARTWERGRNERRTPHGLGSDLVLMPPLSTNLSGLQDVPTKPLNFTLALPQLHATRFSFTQHFYLRPQNFGESWSELSNRDVVRWGGVEVDPHSYPKWVMIFLFWICQWKPCCRNFIEMFNRCGSHSISSLAFYKLRYKNKMLKSKVESSMNFHTYTFMQLPSSSRSGTFPLLRRFLCLHPVNIDPPTSQGKQYSVSINEDWLCLFLSI